MWSLEELLKMTDKTKFTQYIKNLKDSRKIYEIAEIYCDKTCKQWRISPMGCAYKCEVWKLKNTILEKDLH